MNGSKYPVNYHEARGHLAQLSLGFSQLATIDFACLTDMRVNNARSKKQWRCSLSASSCLSPLVEFAKRSARHSESADAARMPMTRQRKQELSMVPACSCSQDSLRLCAVPAIDVDEAAFEFEL